MAGEWRETTVGEFAPFTYGKGLPESQRDSSGKIPVFGSNGIVGYHSKALTAGPTVVIGRKGTAGAVHYSSVACWPIDTTFYIVDDDPLVLRFKYYLLKFLNLEHMNSDSAVPGLNREAAHALKVFVPPLPEQRAIAAVLGALDDKIELNRRMNRTLEAIAQAVFRHWFVENEEAEGWEVGRIKDVCEKIENGGTPRRDRPEFWEPGIIPWLTSGEVRQEIIVSVENKISEEGFKNSSAKMWRKGTTVVALYGATAGQVAFTAQELCANQACCGLIPDNGWQYFVYLTLSSAEDLLSLQARGSAQQNLSQQIVADFPIRRPPDEMLDKFNQIVEPLFEKWISNLKQSRTLAALRDALLPKLMRGEVRVTVHE